MLIAGADTKSIINIQGYAIYATSSLISLFQIWRKRRNAENDTRNFHEFCGEDEMSAAAADSLDSPKLFMSSRFIFMDTDIG